jgi:site-specific DNA-adenine methylase
MNYYIIGGGKVNLIQRLGSKTTDIKNFVDLLPLDVKTVVEPFGGSFAVIRDVYSDDKYKKYVNDSDPELYYIYKHPEQLKKGLKIWNKIADEKITTDEKKEKLMKQKININVKNYISRSLIIRGSIAKKKNIDNIDEQINFIKKINFSNEDAFKFMNKFLFKKDTFIFLDPPYLFSDNTPYKTQREDTDATNYYIYFLEILKNPRVKAKIMLIINDLKILRWIYKNYIKGQYERVYQLGKKKSTHLIITNY